MNFKKMMAAFTAIAACASLCVPAMAFAEDTAAAESTALTAYLDFTNSGWWPAFHNDPENDTLKGTVAEITGDGSYTVSLSAADLGEEAIQNSIKGAEFMAIYIPGAEAIYPNLVITVDKITADDKEIPLIKKNFTNCELEAKEADRTYTTRTNIYNQWASGYTSDARCVDGLVSDLPNADDYDAQIIDPTELAAWTNLTVDFTITGMTAEETTETESDSETEATETESETESVPATEEPTQEATEKQEKTVVGNSYLDFVDGGWYPMFRNNTQKPEEDTLKATFAEITGNGTYTVSVSAADLGEETIANSVSGVEFMALYVPGAEKDYPEMVLTVDSIKADDKEVKLTAKNFTNCELEKKEEDRTYTTRTNIYNQWASGYTEDARCVDGLVSELPNADEYDCQIIDPNDEALKGWTTLEVTFTVSGLSFDKYVGEETTESTETTKATETTKSTTSTTKATTKTTTATTKATTKAASSATTGSTGAESPKTGDASLPVAAGAAAVVAAAAVLITKKKNN